MTRSIGVTVIAVLSLLGSVFTLLMGVVMAWVMFRVPDPSPSQFPGSPTFFKLMLSLAVLMYVLPAIWGIWTSIGLFKLKSWARLSILVFSVLLILMSGCGGLMSLVVPIPSPPNQPSDPAIASGVRIFMGVFSATLTGLGIWWVVFFNRAKVRQQFVSAVPVPEDGPLLPASYAMQSPQVVTRTQRVAQRPLSFTILAWFLLVGCLFIPLNLWLHTPGVLLTKVLIGWPAAVFYLVHAALQLYIGIGLLRLRPAARVVGIWYFVFAFANAAVFYLTPGGHARMLTLLERQRSMFPWMQPWQNQSGFAFDPAPFMVIGMIVGLAWLLVPLYFLVTRKQAFEKAGAAAAD